RGDRRRAEALPAGQPALPDRPAGARGARRQARAPAGAGQLEARRLPREAPKGSLGPAVRLPESRPERRDRRLQHRRRRRAGRHRAGRRHRVVGPLTRAGITSKSGGAVAGFTLVEILVAVAIVAIVSVAAFLTWRGGDAGTLRRDAERFAGALEYAAQRAQWRHEDLGVSVDASGYRFWQRDLERDAWVPLAGDDVLVARAWPDGSAL